MRGGPKFKDCQECRMHEYYVKQLKAIKWQLHVDKRLPYHHNRHYGADRRNWRNSLGDDYREVAVCELCKDADKLWQNEKYYENYSKKNERHYILHKGFDEHKVAWYRSDWEYRQDLSSAEHEFFETMNAWHIVSPWMWEYKGWVAISEGGYETQWNYSLNEQVNYWSQWFGYPNNKEGY